MRILHIINTLAVGGAETTLYRLVVEDTKNEHIIISLKSEGKYAKPLQKLINCKVFVINMNSSFISIAVFRKINQIIKDSKPQILQFWMYHSIFVGSLFSLIHKNIKSIWCIHAPYNKKLTNTQTRIIIKICSFFSYVLPDLIVYCSQYSLKRHSKIGYSKSKAKFIPNGYPTNEFKPDINAREKINNDFNLKKNIILTSMIARFDPHKDHENLFKSLKILNSNKCPIVCLLIGPEIDEYNINLMQLIDKYKIEDNVILMGIRHDIAEILASVDINILSSVSEAFPNVLLESMSCGTPCVTTNVGDTEFIVNKNGWLVEPKNSVALSNAIVDAISYKKNNALWMKLKTDCRNHIIKEFSIEKMKNEFTYEWRQLLKNT